MASAPVESLARQRTGEFVAQPLVLAEHEADLPAAHADIAGRDVGIRADMPLQFGHERLAETHHFVVGLALGVEVRTALAAAHRQRGQAVLERLLESEELQNAQIHRRMESDTAFVRPDRAVHLDAVSFVDFYFTLIVEPRNTEHDDPLGLGDTLEHLHFLKHGILQDILRQRLHDLVHRLVKLFLSGILGYDLSHEVIHILLNVFFHWTWGLRVFYSVSDGKNSAMKPKKQTE